MGLRTFLLILLSAGVLYGQVKVPPDPSKDAVYVCPMDPDVRSRNPGMCERCGMKLAAGIPDPVAFHVDLTTTPQPPKPQVRTDLKFAIHDPWKSRPVNKFVVIHEKLFHLFAVSQDLEFFEHGHPAFSGDGVFQYPITFPKAGMFRLLEDFYPEGATPQLITNTIFVPGTPPAPVKLSRDYAAKAGQNIHVSLETIPAQPIASERTHLRFVVDPAEGLEKYLGAWSHMLAASDDLIDMMHQHPFAAEGGPLVDFSVVFPRARTYRIWVQFQRNGTVNTVHFDVPVKGPEQSEGN